MKQKKRYRILATLLSVMLLIGLMPAAAFAAGTTATVQINGTRLADETPVQCGEGTAVLDAQNQTLTLDHATIEQSGANIPLRIDSGNLTVILVGENKITSVDQRPLYGGSADIIIQSTDGSGTLTIESDYDGLQLDNSNLTIDGCTVKVFNNSDNPYSVGIAANYDPVYAPDKGVLCIQNGANVTAYGKLLGISGGKSLSITDSVVEATADAAEANAIYVDGTLAITNSSVTANTLSEQSYPAIYAKLDAVFTDSKMTVSANGDVALFSPKTFTIEDSLVYVTAPSGKDAIRGNGGTSITGSWVETKGGPVNEKAVLTDSAVFMDNVGTVTGSLTLPGDVEVTKDMALTIPAGASLTVPNGKSFTNHGTITLEGAFVRETGSIIVCDNHTGGTATSDAQAVCAICGTPYGSLLPPETGNSDNSMQWVAFLLVSAITGTLVFRKKKQMN